MPGGEPVLLGEGGYSGVCAPVPRGVVGSALRVAALNQLSGHGLCFGIQASCMIPLQTEQVSLLCSSLMASEHGTVWTRPLFVVQCNVVLVEEIVANLAVDC